MAGYAETISFGSSAIFMFEIRSFPSPSHERFGLIGNFQYLYIISYCLSLINFKMLLDKSQLGCCNAQQPSVDGVLTLRIQLPKNRQVSGNLLQLTDQLPCRRLKYERFTRREPSFSFTMNFCFSISFKRRLRCSGVTAMTCAISLCFNGK